MNVPEGVDAREALVTMSEMLQARIAAATLVEVLSEQDGKLREVMEEPDGRRFVMTLFSEEAVKRTEDRGLSFPDAWAGTRQLFSESGIAVPQSVLLPSNDGHPYIVISEHLADSLAVQDAPIEAKRGLAHNLGQLLKEGHGFMPAIEVLRSDAFQIVRNDEGEYQAVLVDPEPFVVERPGDDISTKDVLAAQCIDKLADLTWHGWANEEGEQGQLVTALFHSVRHVLGDQIPPLEPVGEAVIKLHIMHQGLNLKEFGISLKDI